MRGLSFIGLHRDNRDQGHSQVPYFFEQAMQSGLIDHRAGEQRIAVFIQGDRQAFEPVSPLTVEVALDPDLVDHGVARIHL